MANPSPLFFSSFFLIPSFSPGLGALQAGAACSVPGLALVFFTLPFWLKPFWFKGSIYVGRAWRRVLPLLGGSGRLRAVDGATLALSLVSRVVKLAGITSRGWRSGRCGTAGLSCRSVARLLRLRKMRQGLPHFVRFRVAAALALGSVGQPRPSRAQLAACSACVRHSLQRLK